MMQVATFIFWSDRQYIFFSVRYLKKYFTLKQNKLHKNSIKNPYWSSEYNFIFGEKGIYGKLVGLQKTKILFEWPSRNKENEKNIQLNYSPITSLWTSWKKLNINNLMYLKQLQYYIRTILNNDLKWQPHEIPTNAK